MSGARNEFATGMKIKLFTIPNFITIANLLCGSVSIVAALVWHDLTLAAALVALAAVFDFCDGLAARLLDSYSAVGVQLDSLADMVSFGVAPAMSLCVLSGWSPSLLTAGDSLCGRLLVFTPLIIAAFSALRLAKFNVDDTQHEEFAGLPTPACAIFCVSLGWCCTVKGLAMGREWITLLAVVLSALMVSPIRMFSFKMHSYGWHGNELRYCFLAAAVALIFLLGAYSVPAIIVLYIVTSTVRWTTSGRRKP